MSDIFPFLCILFCDVASSSVAHKKKQSGRFFMIFMSTRSQSLMFFGKALNVCGSLDPKLLQYYIFIFNEDQAFCSYTVPSS